MMKKGFSLVEMMMVLALISIMAGVFILSFASAQRDSVLEEAEASVIHAFESARNRSTVGVGEEDHGVWMKGSEIRIFTGNEYHDDSVDRVINLPSLIESNLISDDISLVFERITGNPESDDWGGDDEIEIVLKDGSTGKETVITIKKNGSIDIE